MSGLKSKGIKYMNEKEGKGATQWKEQIKQICSKHWKCWGWRRKQKGEKYFTEDYTEIGW